MASANRHATGVYDPYTRMVLTGDQTKTAVNDPLATQAAAQARQIANQKTTAPAATTQQKLNQALGNIASTAGNAVANFGQSAAAQKTSTLDSLISQYQKQANRQATAQGKKTGTGTGSGGAPAVDPDAAQYAQYVAESYSRSMPSGNPPVWEDKWQPQIDALQGGRYGPYDSPYQARIDGLLDRLLNREEFRYNWSDDPLYRQYAARYQQQARQGMQDAMGQAAALTGGYGSTYGQAAGQQAYANQMQGLNDRAMELYQAAKDRYDTETARQFQNMDMLERREGVNRGMYQDDRDTWYARQDADIANLRNSQLMGFNVYQDAADREMAERQMAWDQYQYWNGLYEAMKNKGGSGGGKSKTDPTNMLDFLTAQYQANQAAQGLGSNVGTSFADALEEERRRRLLQGQGVPSNWKMSGSGRTNMDR